MNHKGRKLQLWVDHLTWDILHKLSERSHIPMSVIVRHGIDLAIGWVEEKLEAEELGRQVWAERDARRP